MKNPRITPKERNLIKGAVRRVFSRSELRQSVLDRVTVQHSDPNRPRVTKWGYCELCGVLTPRYLLQVDHILPIISLHKTLEMLSWDELVDGIWCEPSNLQALDETCHRAKTKAENKLRRASKK